MSLVEEAIFWDGTYANLALYAVYDQAPTAIPCFATESIKPIKNPSGFQLDDEDKVLNGRLIYVYDIVLEEIPDNLSDYLGFCARTIISKGASLCWFSFDGGFSFESVLCAEEADQVYLLADRSGNLDMALEDETLLSPGWRSKVNSYRNRLLQPAQLLPHSSDRRG